MVSLICGPGHTLSGRVCIFAIRIFILIQIRSVMAYKYVGVGLPSCYPLCKIDYNSGSYTSVS